MQPLKKALRNIFSTNLYNKLVIPRHYAESVIAGVRYGFPSRGMLVIGVTGTNGKTTTSNMLASIFTAAGHKVGLSSSAVLQFGDERRENDTHLTTASAWHLQQLLARMRDKGCNVVILEVSSHALVQGRVWSIDFDAAVMTNLTQDHLDYHGTMENYAAAKAKLFKKAKHLSVLNLDDAYFTTFKEASRAPVRTYGQHQLADSHLIGHELSPKGATFTVEQGSKEHHFSIHLTGLFNVYNATAAATVAWFYKISDTAIQKGLDALDHVPGRMQAINEGQPFTVIIDHAHTEDALLNLFTELKKIAKKRIIVVIGCDGDRDPGKREPIGKLSAEFADELILTDLENNTEDPEKIRSMVRKGIQEVPGAKWQEIPDRTEAIEVAMRLAQPDDVVVIPGMGNQDYRGMAEGKIAWDDREVARKAIHKVLGN